jgi:nitroreductase
MDYFKLIEARHSCRSYMNTPVKRAQIDKCLEAARLAPSACNCQPWRYVVADNPVLVKKLAPLVRLEGSSTNRFSDEVPVFVAVAEKPVDLRRPGVVMLRENYSELDIGLSVAHFCLAAAEQGLGTCIMGIFQEEPIKALLGIPEDFILRLVLALGHPAGPGREKNRLPLPEVAAYNAFTPEMK